MRERLHFLPWKVKPFLRRIQVPETLCRPSRPPPRAAVPQLRRVGLPAARSRPRAEDCPQRLTDAPSLGGQDASVRPSAGARLTREHRDHPPCLTRGGPPGGHTPGPFPEVQTSSAFTRDHSSPGVPPVNLLHPNPCLRLRF